MERAWHTQMLPEVQASLVFFWKASLSLLPWITCPHFPAPLPWLACPNYPGSEKKKDTQKVFMATDAVSSGSVGVGRAPEKDILQTVPSLCPPPQSRLLAQVGETE